VRSINTELAPPVPEGDPLLLGLAGSDEPFEPAPLAVSAAWREATRASLVAPLQSGRDLIGFVALGPARGGYATDDRNLLRAIARHVAVLLAHARLAEERRGAAEIEALHRVSAFCVHDLKNLAASLALVARNAESHGHDPAFQESALRTVARTSDRIMHLVQRLSRRGPPAQEGMGPWDLPGIVEEAVASLDGSCPLEVTIAQGGMAQVSGNRHELQQVLLNLLLNAKEALAARQPPLAAGETGMRVRVVPGGAFARVEVTDRGPGLSPEAVRRLFEPFRSTKDGGLGIGLYECRRIVEGLGGRIRVTSVLGEGTTFQVELPAVPGAG
jgi:putative PEP-CTERM system histidine kinase